MRRREAHCKNSDGRGKVRFPPLKFLLGKMAFQGWRVVPTGWVQLLDSRAAKEKGGPGLGLRWQGLRTRAQDTGLSMGWFRGPQDKRDLAWPRLVERGGPVLSGIGHRHHMPGRWVKVPGPLKKVRAGATDCRHQKETGVQFLQTLSSSQQITGALGKQRPMGGHGACVQED